MKPIFISAVLCVVLAGASFAQAQPNPAAAQPATSSASASAKESVGTPTRFDLDFKGGSVRALFDAISAAQGKPVNVYIPQAGEAVKIAPFRVTGVTVRELLDAISNADVVRGKIARASGYRFLTSGGSGDSVVYAMTVVDPRDEPETVCRVYSLSPYLEAGLSVDDITTAIRTSWKMLNYTPPTVNLSYHRETKLLIAVVPSEEIQAIEQVLAALPKGPSGKKALPAIQAEPTKTPAAKL